MSSTDQQLVLDLEKYLCKESYDHIRLMSSGINYVIQDPKEKTNIIKICNEYLHELYSTVSYLKMAEDDKLDIFSLKSVLHTVCSNESDIMREKFKSYNDYSIFKISLGLEANIVKGTLGPKNKVSLACDRLIVVDKIIDILSMTFDGQPRGRIRRDFERMIRTNLT